MEIREALLMTQKNVFNQRSLHEMEGTRDRRMWSNDPNTIFHSVKVRLASDELIKSELLKLGLVIEDMPTILKVAGRFWQDLCSIEEGKLAVYWNGSSWKLWEIVEIIKEETRMD
ncbi:MAG TPA: hypothetical protein VK153_00005 [Candidatus Paceibacterota bacterium]|nr:hypothetical protein [Candidatus Paceibacterota bacterium]